jgi:hypothetical protein
LAELECVIIVLHGLEFRRIEIFIVTAMRTSNLTRFNGSLFCNKLRAECTINYKSKKYLE